MDELLDLCNDTLELNGGYMRLSRAESHDDGEKLVLSLRLHDPINEREEDWQVSCLGVQENRLAFELHDALEVRDDHPRLVPYREPWLDLYYASAPDDERAFLEDMRAAHDLGPFGQYGLGQNLSMGYGLFARGPAALLRRYEAVLEKHGMRPSVLWNQDESPRSLRLLAFEYRSGWDVDSFVIAEEFFAQRVVPAG